VIVAGKGAEEDAPPIAKSSPPGRKTKGEERRREKGKGEEPA